jgi:glycosyltransferase involved in cell wall biosynthesis
MTPVRISIVTETYVPDVNGVANSLRHLIQALDPQRFRIQIIRTSPKTDWVPEVEEEWVPGVTIPMYPDLQLGLPARKRVADVWNQFQPDLVFIATEGLLGNSALKEAQKRGLPVLSAFHTNFHRYSSYYGLGWIKTLTLNWLRHFHNRTLGTLVPSAESAHFLRRSGFHNVHVLPHGVDCELFHPRRRSVSLRQLWGVADDDPVALYVGRIAAEKNIPQVIDSYRQLKQEYPGLKLVMVGDGPMRLELECRYPDIVFAGVQTGEALARFYASADLFMFASVTETFGLVTLEAMASGLPVVAFNMAAAAQFVRNGIDGQLAEVDNAESFSQALRKLLQLDLFQAGQQARSRAEQASWASVTSSFDQHVSRALNQTEQQITEQVQTMV